LTTPILFSTATFEKPVPTDNDQTLNLSSDNGRASSQKRSFIRYFLPISRSRSSSIQNEPQKSFQDQSNNTCDMRLFIIRHGERVDRYFGPNWYKIAFDQHEQYRPYHRNFPTNLPLRSNSSFWAFDTPLTSLGMSSAEKLGQRLKSKNFRPHYIYSSPAMRCILTTIQILKGLQLEHPIPIRIEPGLLEYGAARFGMNIFFQPFDWHKYGINVDLSYQPIITHIPPIEQEEAYYLRSKHVIREIEKRHQHSSKESLNIFIIAHATSPETLTWDLIGKKPNTGDLYRLSLNIAYLQTVITERQHENKFWSLKRIRSI
jgi:broad specificity phosphatase PhoE